MDSAFGLIQGGSDIVPVTLNDSNPNVYRAWMVGDVSGGTALRITTPAGNVRTLTGLVAGYIYPIPCTKMHSTSTTVASVFGIP